MTDRDDEIRRQVQERVAREAATAPAEEHPGLSSQFIQECLFANEQGDGVLYATLFRDRFVYCKNTMEWYEWQGHSWKRDIMNRSLAAVEELVARYMAEYKALGGKIADLAAEIHLAVDRAHLVDQPIHRGIAGIDRKSTRLNSSHEVPSRMPSSA